MQDIAVNEGNGSGNSVLGIESGVGCKGLLHRSTESDGVESVRMEDDGLDRSDQMVERDVEETGETLVDKIRADQNVDKGSIALMSEVGVEQNVEKGDDLEWPVPGNVADGMETDQGGDQGIQGGSKPKDIMDAMQYDSDGEVTLAKFKKSRRLRKAEVKSVLEDDTGDMMEMSRDENQSSLKDVVGEVEETLAKTKKHRRLKKREVKDSLEADVGNAVETSTNINQNLDGNKVKGSLEAGIGNAEQTSLDISQNTKGNIDRDVEETIGSGVADVIPNKRKKPRRLKKREAKDGLEEDVKNTAETSPALNQSLKSTTAQELEDNLGVGEADDIPAKQKKTRRLRKRQNKDDLETVVKNHAEISIDIDQSLKGNIAQDPQDSLFVREAQGMPAKTKKPRRLKKGEVKDNLEAYVENTIETSGDINQSLKGKSYQNSEDNLDHLEKKTKSTKTSKKLPKVASSSRQASTSENDIKEMGRIDNGLKRQKMSASPQDSPDVEKRRTGKGSKAAKVGDSNLEGLKKHVVDKDKRQTEQRVLRHAKKRRLGDMAYEGDSDWDVLVNGEEASGIKNSDKERLGRGRARGGLTSSLLAQMVPGEEAAVAAGLKIREPGPAEKIRFKEVLKRRGGLQEYLECRNSILWLWGKDVCRILPLMECGVSPVPLEDETPRASLIRDIYNFLDYHGYINIGVAAKKQKTEVDSGPKLKLSQECTQIEKLGDKEVDAEEEVAFILGQIKGSDENGLNGQTPVQVGVESQITLLNMEDLKLKNLAHDCSELGMIERKHSEECGVALMEIDENPSLAQSNEDNATAGTEISLHVENKTGIEITASANAKKDIGTMNISGSCGIAGQDSCVKAEADPVMKVTSALDWIRSYDEDEFSDIDSAKVLHNLRKHELQTDSLSDKQEAMSNSVSESKSNAQFFLKDQKKIIVVGAGPAGLAAARHLQRLNFHVTVLEARDRVGGRVYTDRSSLSVPVDLGASIITGVEADVATERRPDPSALLCTQLGLELTVLNSDCPLYDSVTGEKVPANLDEALELEYNGLLDDMLMLVAQNGDTAMRMSLEEGLEYALKKRRMARSNTVSELVSNNILPNDHDGRSIEQNPSVRGPEPLVGVVNEGLTAVPEGNVSDVAAKEKGIDKDSVCDNADLSDNSSSEQKYLSQLERRVMDWHFANLEYGCAAELGRVSLPYWNQDDAYGGFGGAHCMIKGGYSTIMEALAEGLNIHLDHVVTEIVYSLKDTNLKGESKRQVKICTANSREFVGDAVLITVPLGCLKANAIKFSPALPSWKHDSIQRLGFGVLNKVVMEFPMVFWDENVDYFGATAESTELRGRCFMFWNLKKTVGAPVLIALVVGKAAVDGQNTETSEHVQHAVTTLRKLFGESSVPDPIASVSTNWGGDPFSRGAYSYVAVGASGEDYDILGRPVENCLFFAGEATCKEHPDTVGGAIMSGVREAVRIIDILQNREDSMAEAEAMAAAQRQSESERNEVRDLRKRLDAGELSSVLCKETLDGEQKPLSKDVLLEDMFGSAKTTGGRKLLAEEMLKLPAAAVKSFAGTKEGLSILDKWILDSMGKDGTQLLRHCVRLLLIVSTDILPIRQSGIGRTVKEKVINHTSRDIRNVANQLVNMWVELFRKEKANGGFKLLKQSHGPAKNSGLSDAAKAKVKEQSSGKHSNLAANGFKGSFVESTFAKDNSTIAFNIKTSELQSTQLEAGHEHKNESNFVGEQSSGQANQLGDRALSEYEAAAIAAEKAAQAAALAAAEAMASEAECNTYRELPKIPSFHKFAKREQHVQKDDSEIRKRKWSGAVLGKQDCSSEIDSRSCRVRNWSVDFASTCGNLDSSGVANLDYAGGTLDSNNKQRSKSNDIDSHSDLKERSAETGTVDSRSTKSRARKPYTLGSDSDAFDQSIQKLNDKYSNKIEQLPIDNPRHGSDDKCVAEAGSNKGSPRTKNGHKDEGRGLEHIKKGITEYVAQLLMPLYKTKKIDRDGYKSIMKKSTIKVIEHITPTENAMTTSEFLDIKRKNKIRSLVDKFIERHLANAHR